MDFPSRPSLWDLAGTADRFGQLGSIEVEGASLESLR